MQCCLSQKVPLEPVVARTSGCLFERTLIERYIEENGRCPVTGEPLSKEDLLPLRPATPAASTAATAATGAASIPGLLVHLHKEWEGMALEQFTLRQQLAQSQQELAHALQQYEAACVVVARLTEERDALRAAQGDGTHQDARDEEDDEKAVVVPAALAKAMDTQEAERRQQRKEAKKAQATVAASTAAAATKLRTLSGPTSVRVGGARGAALSVACAQAAPLLFAGSSGENEVVRYDVASHKVTHRGVGHAGPVTAVRAFGAATAATSTEVLSASADRTVRLWQPAPAEALTCTRTLRYEHALAGVAHDLLCEHHLLVAGDATVTVSDLAQGVHVATTSAVDEGALVAVEMHPYGALAGLGTSRGELVLFDIRRMTVDTAVPLAQRGGEWASAVSCVAFHADCLSVAVGLASGVVQLWDLRRLEEPVASLPAPASKKKSVPATAAFQPSHGAFMAVATEGLAVYETETVRRDGASATPLFTHSAARAIKEVSWGFDSSFLAACTLDGAVDVFQCA